MGQNLTVTCASVKGVDAPHNEGMHPAAQEPGGG